MIDMQKICFINGIIRNDKSTETTKELLKADHEGVKEWNKKHITNSNARKKPKEKESVYDEVVRLCRKYNVPPIFECRMDNDTIKSIMRKSAQLELWNDTKEGVYCVPRNRPKIKKKAYHKYNRMEGRAILLWRCGMLKFRRYQREYNIKKGIPIDCPFGFCVDEDTMNHALECMFSPVKLEQWVPGSIEDDRMIKFILELHSERLKYERSLF